ncbi:lysylphosphatidylglycerol synthase transmembrane domain-containing protein [Natrinema salifodinae]|uniref:Lysylphosphatidylglycerol synthase TM region n=1 Tax=Natrinema salifodinae TaxID=1202768 RepID=A0A1I0M963_9EURY|nr:lysylphosphatidylglycerol synthase transmembrane domain-containing protein [Natrinema salifodinae]SEV83911.1 hypothetical protein SAMN05216285_0548 [Natrinema salifodinae]
MNVDRGQLFSVVKVAVIAFSVYYLHETVPFTDVVSVVTIPSRFELFAASVTVIATTLLTSRILQLLASPYADIPLPVFAKIYVMNFSLNSFIPSKAGSLLTMPFLIDRNTDIEKKDGLNIQLTNLVLTAVTLGTTTLVGLLALVSILEYEIALVLFSSGMAYLAIPVLSLGLHSTANVPIVDVPIDRLDYATFDRSLIAKCFLLTILTVVCIVGLRFAIVTSSVGVSFPVAYYFVIPVLVYAVSVLPISVGGIGISELTGTNVLIALGVEPDVAAAIILLDRSISFYIPVVLAYIYTMTELRQYENSIY